MQDPFVDRLAGRLQTLKSSAIREILKLASQPDVTSFAGGLPAPELFPMDEIRAAADRVLLAPLGRSGLTTEERLDTQAVAAELRRLGKSALACTSLSELVTDLLASAEPGDTVALLSNGAFGGIPAQLLAGFGERTLTEPNRGAV